MKTSLKERWKYWLDNYMAKGSSSIFLALLITFLVGFFLLVIGRFIVGWAVSETDSNIGVWTTFLQLTDPGNMAQDNDSQWYVKIVSVFSGMFGIIFFSAVIAFITTQLDIKLHTLKKGKSQVLEKNHIVILGWNNEITDIIRELIIANESEKKASIVILSSVQKEDMDDLLNEQISDFKTTHVITRFGKISSINDLKRVAVDQAKSLIILPYCHSGSQESEKTISDAYTLKAVLAVSTSCSGDNKPPIVTQVYNPLNRTIIQSLYDPIIIIDPEDMVAKIAVQTSRSSGLADVYSKLIGFEGSEFYFTRSKWNNVAFGDIHYHYPDGIPIGLRTKDGKIRINPPTNHLMQDDEDIIILAEDDSTIQFSTKQLFHPKDYPYVGIRNSNQKERTLIVGWNNKSLTIIEQFCDYMTEGSKIDIVLGLVDKGIEEKIHHINGLKAGYEINTIYCNLFDNDEISGLRPESYDNIILLASTEENQELCDARTINTLLLLREAISKKPRDSDFKDKIQIIAEVLNVENLELVSKAGVNDAIISTEMVSKIISQIVEEPDLLNVYEEIFEEDGSEIYIKPITLYFSDPPKEVTFTDLIHATQKREEICIGYREKYYDNDGDIQSEVVLNPAKNEVIALNRVDNLIVIAEDEL